MKMISSKLLLSLMTTMVLVGCQSGDDEEADGVDETTTEESTQTQEISIQIVFQNELSDQEPIEYTDLEGTEDILLFSPDVNEAHSVSEDYVPSYILFYNLVDETLKVGHTSFDQDNESAMLGSSDFQEHIKEYAVTDVQFTEDSVLIETDAETFEFTEVTVNEVEDQDGNTYLIYEKNVEDILEKYSE